MSSEECSVCLTWMDPFIYMVVQWSGFRGCHCQMHFGDLHVTYLSQKDKFTKLEWQASVILKYTCYIQIYFTIPWKLSKTSQIGLKIVFLILMDLCGISNGVPLTLGGQSFWVRNILRIARRRSLLHLPVLPTNCTAPLLLQQPFSFTFWDAC
jgi:hypothetical protein